MSDKISNSLLKTVYYFINSSYISAIINCYLISQIAREVSCWQNVKWIQKYAHLALSVYEKGNQSHFAMKNVACMHALTPLHFMKRCDVENGVIFRRGGKFFYAWRYIDVWRNRSCEEARQQPFIQLKNQFWDFWVDLL